MSLNEDQISLRALELVRPGIYQAFGLCGTGPALSPGLGLFQLYLSTEYRRAYDYNLMKLKF